MLHRNSYWVQTSRLRRPIYCISFYFIVRTVPHLYHVTTSRSCHDLLKKTLLKITVPDTQIQHPLMNEGSDRETQHPTVATSLSAQWCCRVVNFSVTILTLSVIAGVAFVRYDTSDCLKEPCSFPTMENVGLQGQRAFILELSTGIARSTHFQLLSGWYRPLKVSSLCLLLLPHYTIHTHTLTQPQQIRRMGGWLCSRMTSLSLSLQLAGSMGPSARESLILFHLPMHVIPLWNHIKYMVQRLCVTVLGEF